MKEFQDYLLDDQIKDTRLTQANDLYRETYPEWLLSKKPMDIEIVQFHLSAPGTVPGTWVSFELDSYTQDGNTILVFWSNSNPGGGVEVPVVFDYASNPYTVIAATPVSEPSAPSGIGAAISLSAVNTRNITLSHSVPHYSCAAVFELANLPPELIPVNLVTKGGVGTDAETGQLTPVANALVFASCCYEWQNPGATITPAWTGSTEYEINDTMNIGMGTHVDSKFCPKGVKQEPKWTIGQPWSWGAFAFALIGKLA